MDPAISSLIDRTGLDKAKVRQLLGRGLEGADDGELFLEYKQSEALVYDNGRLKQATYDTTQGFGLRAVKGDAVGYAHASDMSEAALTRAAEAVRAVKGGYSGSYAEAPGRTNRKLYGDENPLAAPAFADPSVPAITAAPVSDREVDVAWAWPAGAVYPDAVEVLRNGVNVSGPLPPLGAQSYADRATAPGGAPLPNTQYTYTVVDVVGGTVRNLSAGTELAGRPTDAFLLSMLRAGGLIPLVREQGPRLGIA